MVTTVGPKSTTAVAVVGGGACSLFTRWPDEFRSLSAHEPFDDGRAIAEGDGNVQFTAAVDAIAADLVQYAAGDRIDLVAAGWGGAVALQLAADRPELVRRLALIAPSGAGHSVLGRPPISLSELLKSAWTDAPSLPAMAELALGAGADFLDAPGPPPEALRQPILHEIAITEQALPTRLRKVKAPTLLLWGQEDHVEPLDRAFFAHRRLPHSSLRVLADAGHLLGHERPAEVTGVIRRYLAQT